MDQKQSARCNLLLLVVGVLLSALDACDEGKFGPNCNLVCHCKNVTKCNVKGICLNSGECQNGWTGPSCQIRIDNVALDKNTFGGPVKNSKNTGFAVDRNLTSYTWLQNQTPNASVYWAVDLGKTYDIHAVNVIFYEPEGLDTNNMIKKRRPGFSLLLKETNDSQRITCHKDTSTEEFPATNQSYTNCSGPARYVYLENSREMDNVSSKWSKFPNLELTEVEVLADIGCSNGTYGDQCEKVCGNCADERCDRKTGTCNGECEKGYYGMNCSTPCSANCSQCLKSGVCDGCQDNSFHGDFCNETCKTGCMGKCHQNRTCIDDCQAGVYGNQCDLNCTWCKINKTCSCSRNDGGCLCGCLDTAFYGKYCNDSCSRIDQNCIQCKGDINNGVCLNCSSSHFGNRCENVCPGNCLQCKSDQLCTECTPGYSGMNCSDPCKSEECRHCDKNGDCLECSPGLRGVTCDETCKTGCERCNATGDNCFSCIKGFALLKEIHCWNCSVSEGCLECSGTNNCTLCEPGFYLSGNKCKKCPSNCETCVNDTFCEYCKDNWSGIKCLCSENCTKGNDPKNISSWCNESNGYCLNGCQTGLYTDTCSQPCNKNCYACIQGDGTCLKCSDGRYGFSCDENCGKCMKGICDIDTGKCPGDCESGFYGKFCNMTCSSQCNHDNCEKFSGNCSSCLQGFFGSHCNFTCDEKCDQECEQYTGTCKGCEGSSYFGPYCTEFCNNCEGCNQTGYCLSCKEKLYGDFCNNSCPVNCGHDLWSSHSRIECGRDDGMCKACIPGYFRHNCTEKCGVNCWHEAIGHSCQISDGTCFGCKTGFYGSHCDRKCSSNCARDDSRHHFSGPCLQHNGTCKKGCVNGWHGAHCSLKCNSTCIGCDWMSARCDACVEGYEGDYCETKRTPKSGSVGLIVGILVGIGLIVCICAAVLIICKFRKRTKRKRDNIHLTDTRKSPKREIDKKSIVITGLNGHTQSLPIPNKNYHDGVVGNGESVPLMDDKVSYEAEEPDEIIYTNLDTKILVSGFTENLQQLKANNPLWYTDEFGKLPKGLLKKCSVAKSQENKGKCRYQNLYPYDDNRVVLEPESNNDSDFINASYVNGFRKPQAFIASQGPVDLNVNDFWRMIFQQDCGKIVMLTKLVEECKLKCVKYWPDKGETEVYGNYEVSIVSETVFPDYVLRQLETQNTETKEVKDFKQFHFMSWPDCGVPESPSSMLNFRNRVMEPDPTVPDGPILVHCSAGIGRTGTFIALDYLLREAKEEKYIDVFKTITDMRYQRTNFIQTNIQYEFLHKAISEALTTSHWEVSQQDFHQYFHSLLDVDAETGKTKLEEQYELLNKMSPKVDLSICSAGTNPDNQFKNRFSNILPVDTYRAYLSTPVKGLNEYINAVFLPTSLSKTGFLLTQMPLPQTVTDFWRLVFDQHVTHIVMMNNFDDENGEDDVGEYWPSDDCSYGPFKIELLSCENSDNFSIMNMQLTYTSTIKKTQMLRRFRYENWADSQPVPTDTKHFINSISEVLQSFRTSSSAGEPILVHCHNGAERSGLFCVLSIIMERLNAEQRINLPQVILQLRARRPQLISSLEQFEFCYRAVADYLNELESSEIYSNVF